MSEFWKFVIGLAPGGIPAGAAAYAFYTGNPIWGIIGLLFTYLVVYLYSGAVSGAATLFGVAGIYYIVEQSYGVLVWYAILFILVFLVYHFSPNKNNKNF